MATFRWKLHLRTKHLASSHITDDDIPPLPRDKSAVQVLADFMQYLFTCTRNYIIESEHCGASKWRSMESNIEFILTHPNGWEGLQQQRIRRAAEIAGLVPSGDEHAGRIHLLTEGEASLHFCAGVLGSDSEPLSSLPIVNSDDLEEVVDGGSEQEGIIVIDAGGGTIDLSAYSVKLSAPREFKEIAPSECKTFFLGSPGLSSYSYVVPIGRLQGSVFVTQRAHAFLKGMCSSFFRAQSPHHTLLQSNLPTRDTGHLMLSNK